MTRTSKGSATIHRRKLKHSAQEWTMKKSSSSSTPATSEDESKDVSETEEGYLFDDEILGPSVVKKIMSNEKTLLLSLISFRIVNALVIQTFFVPDEYWQSLEIAHSMVFGYGYKTWEWKNALRGYLHPFIFAALYKCLYILGLDNRVLLIKLPRMLQGVLAAYGDFYLFKLSEKFCDKATAQWTLFCQITSWFTLYCFTRTLSNSTETVFMLIALYYYPWPQRQKSSVFKFLFFAALSVLVRPTAAVIWILLCSWHLQMMKFELKRLIKYYSTAWPITFTLVQNYELTGVSFLNLPPIYAAPVVGSCDMETLTSVMSLGLAALSISLVIDRIYYGQWVIVQYNFLKFNVFTGGSSHYGTHPWHWYFTQGYPVVMTVHLFLFIMGAWRGKNKVLLSLIVWTLVIYSFLSHKEFRFLMSILPLSMHYCGVYFQSLCKKPNLNKRRMKKYTEHVARSSKCSSSDSLETISEGSSTIPSESSGYSSISSSVEIEKHKDDITSGKVADENEQTKAIPSSTNEIPIEDKPNAEISVERHSKITTIPEDESKEESDSSATQAKSEQKTTIIHPELLQQQQHKRNLSKAKILVIILVLTNIPLAFYFCLIHQRGTVVVTKYLADASLEKEVDILFLMPCHSTPYYSYIHRNISMRFLTCEPNLQHINNYMDEADVFYTDPMYWLRQEYAKGKKRWPTHIIAYLPLFLKIDKYLQQNGYRNCGKFFHTHFPEGKVGTHVIVICR